MVWALLLPAMIVSDADNGRLGRDFALLWIPEVVLATSGALTSLILVGAVRRRSRHWTILLTPTALFLAVVIVTLSASARHR